MNRSISIALALSLSACAGGNMGSPVTATASTESQCAATMATWKQASTTRTQCERIAGDGAMQSRREAAAYVLAGKPALDRARSISPEQPGDNAYYAANCAGGRYEQALQAESDANRVLARCHVGN